MWDSYKITAVCDCKSLGLLVAHYCMLFLSRPAIQEPFSLCESQAERGQPDAQLDHEKILRASQSGKQTAHTQKHTKTKEF